MKEFFASKASQAPSEGVKGVKELKELKTIALLLLFFFVSQIFGSLDKNAEICSIKQKTHET